MTYKRLIVTFVFFWPMSALWYAAGLPPWWSPVNDPLRFSLLLTMHVIGSVVSAILIAGWKDFWK